MIAERTHTRARRVSIRIRSDGVKGEAKGDLALVSNLYCIRLGASCSYFFSFSLSLSVFLVLTPTPLLLSPTMKFFSKLSFVEHHPRSCQSIRTEINQKGTIVSTWTTPTARRSNETQTLLSDQNIK